MKSGNPRQVEQIIIEVLDSKDFESLRQLYIEYVELSSSHLARDDISGFVNLGFKLDRAVRRTGFPKGWEDSEGKGNSVTQFQGIFQALRGLAIDITTVSIDREVIEHLKRKLSQMIVLILRREGPLKWVQIKDELEMEKEKLDSNNVRATTITRSLEKLQEFDIVKHIGEFYELTFLGSEIAVTLSERLSSELPLGIRNEIRVLRRAYATLRPPEDLTGDLSPKKAELQALSPSEKEGLIKEIKEFTESVACFLKLLLRS